MSGHDLLVNVSTALSENASEYSFRMPPEVEHFLGHADVLHILALILGAAVIISGMRLPQVLASAASISFGFWLGLVVQDRQQFDQPILGTLHLPRGAWLAMLVALMGCSAAGALAYLMWRMALALLNAGMLMLLSLAACRLANASPEKVFRIGASLLSTYRLVSGIVLFVSFMASVVAVVFRPEEMIAFDAALLGSLLLLSGMSHFAQRFGAAERPFSLLDDLARMLSEVRGGRCELWKSYETQDSGIRGCDCSDHCRTEIILWIIVSWAILSTCWLLQKRLLSRFDDVKKAYFEELQPLAKETEIGVREPEMHADFAGKLSETRMPADVLGRRRV